MSTSITHLPPKAFHLVKSQRAMIDRIKAKGREQAERATHTALVGGTAVALGYFETRHGRTEFAGAKTSLLVAVVGHTVAMAGPSAYSDYAAAVGDGGVAVMAYQFGRETGQRHANEANNTAPRLR
jgi:hypothetical protein